MGKEIATNKRVNFATKFLWNNHQANEKLHVDHYKEGWCWNCANRNVVAATLVDSCETCFNKRDPEHILAQVTPEPKIHSLCFCCGEYKQWVIQYNVRLCFRCHREVAQIMKRWNKKGGMFGNDPFWLKMRRKYGKDWKSEIWKSPARQAL